MRQNCYGMYTFSSSLLNDDITLSWRYFTQNQFIATQLLYRSVYKFVNIHCNALGASRSHQYNLFVMENELMIIIIQFFIISVLHQLPKVYGATTQKTAIFIVAAVRT
jgi:hypothetical protein